MAHKTYFAGKKPDRRNKISMLTKKEWIPLIFQFQGYEIDLSRKSVKFKGNIIRLTRKEFDLIRLLAMNQGRIFSREQLLSHIWGSNYYGSERAVDNLMWRIRNKLQRLRIETVYGYGYRVN